MKIIRYLMLLIILTIIYIVSVFGGAIIGIKGLLPILTLLFILIITPYLGKLILKENKKKDIFYISYIILIIVILPTSGDLAFNINYPYFIFDLMDINHFHSAKGGIAESYIYPMLTIPIICVIMVANYLYNNY